MVRMAASDFSSVISVIGCQTPCLLLLCSLSRRRTSGDGDYGRFCVLLLEIDMFDLMRVGCVMWPFSAEKDGPMKST